MEVLRKLLGNRNVLTPGVERNAHQQMLLTQGLNEAFVVFSGSPKVLEALREFKEAASNVKSERLLEVFKVLCDDLGLNTKPLNDSFFMEPFSIN